jgi:hypothetical protein
MKIRRRLAVGVCVCALAVGFLLLTGGEIAPIYVESVAADPEAIRSTAASVSIGTQADGAGTLTVNARPSLGFYRLKAVGLFRFAKETNGKELAEMVESRSPSLKNAEEVRDSVPATFAFDPNSRSKYVVMVSYKRINLFGLLPSKFRRYFYPVSELALK